jgi:hypothetical protein
MRAPRKLTLRPRTADVQDHVAGDWAARQYWRAFRDGISLAMEALT